jgi:hypothetical protein
VSRRLVTARLVRLLLGSGGFFGGTTRANTRSNAFGSSSQPSSRAVSMKRRDCSMSCSFCVGAGFRRAFDMQWNSDCPGPARLAFSLVASGDQAFPAALAKRPASCELYARPQLPASTLSGARSEAAFDPRSTLRAASRSFPNYKGLAKTNRALPS